jgi:hypothetical protein
MVMAMDSRNRSKNLEICSRARAAGGSTLQARFPRRRKRPLFGKSGAITFRESGAVALKQHGAKEAGSRSPTISVRRRFAYKTPDRKMIAYSKPTYRRHILRIRRPKRLAESRQDNIKSHLSNQKNAAKLHRKFIW